MSSIDVNSFVKILTNGLKFYLKNEKVKIEESDFQILENELFSEFSLPYIDQTQTPTQFLKILVKSFLEALAQQLNIVTFNYFIRALLQHVQIFLQLRIIKIQINFYMLNRKHNQSFWLMDRIKI